MNRSGKERKGGKNLSQHFPNHSTNGNSGCRFGQTHCSAWLVTRPTRMNPSGKSIWLKGTITNTPRHPILISKDSLVSNLHLTDNAIPGTQSVCGVHKFIC